MDTPSFKNMSFSEQGFLFDQVTGLTYTLNKTGALIFKYLQEDKPIQEIVDILYEKYNILKDDLSDDVNEFILQMKEYGLLGK